MSEKQTGTDALINALLNLVDQAHVLLGVYTEPNEPIRRYNRAWLVIFQKPYIDNFIERFPDVKDTLSSADHLYPHPVDLDSLIEELKRRNGQSNDRP